MSISRTAKLTLAAIVGLGLAATAIPAKATGNFDGKWSVVVVTTKGTCDRAYRYPIAIRGETLINAGDTAFDIQGRVQGNGAVAVKISYGDQSAHGVGRLSGTMGSGSWSGGACAGTWTAVRRS
jgi:hypothetical protein